MGRRIQRNIEDAIDNVVALKETVTGGPDVTEGTGYGDDGGEVSEEEEPELIASQIVETRESSIVTARAKAVVGQDK